VRMRLRPSMVSVLCLSVAIPIVACSGGSGSPPSSSTSNPDDQAIAGLMTNPGPTVTTIPAGSAIPEVATWEVHSTPQGVGAVGRAPSGTAEVMFEAVLDVSGTQLVVTREAVAVAPGLHYTFHDVVTAIQADVAAATASSPSMSTGAGGLAAETHALGIGALTDDGGSLNSDGGGLLTDAGSNLTCSDTMVHALGAVTLVGGFLAVDGVVLCPFSFVGGPVAGGACYAATAGLGAAAVYAAKRSAACGY
jgi:hypothetical protein